jgi:Zn finger protein HypA/HybF involved in hydrogenase expression
MNQTEIFTYQKKVECLDCKETYLANFQAPAEGFGQEAQLYHCKNCLHPYFHSIEDAQYFGPLSEKVKNTTCVSCAKPLAESLKKVPFLGSCPGCSSRKFRAIERATEVFVSATSLYH